MTNSVNIAEPKSMMLMQHRDAGMARSMFTFRCRNDVKSLMKETAKIQERSLSSIVHKAVIAYCEKVLGCDNLLSADTQD